MKICLLKFKSCSSDSINQVVESSLLDLGHELVDHFEAEVVIGVRDFSRIKEKYTDKKYILYQIEQYNAKQAQVESFYDFEPDEVWGFDIENKKERYIPLGYHPCLRFQPSVQDIDVGFMGWLRGRREEWIKKVKFKPVYFESYNHEGRGSWISRIKVNLHIHFSRVATFFTPWDRLSHFLANDCFFLVENCYCPIDTVYFNAPKDYDELVDFYLSNDEERFLKGKEMGQKYRNEFDMRDILKGLL